MATEHSEPLEDLGFRFRVRKSAEVEIHHRGRLAVTLRSSHAAEFLAQAPNPMDPEAQQLMAHITENYKRGNERLASSHPRNRK